MIDQTTINLVVALLTALLVAYTTWKTAQVHKDLVEVIKPAIEEIKPIVPIILKSNGNTATPSINI